MRELDAEQLFLRLHAALSRLGYTAWSRVRRSDVFDGCPHVYGGFLRFLLTHYSAATATLMRAHAWLLIEDNDVALGASVLRVLHDAFAVHLPLSPLQFAQRRFATQKMHMCLCLLRCLRGVHRAHGATPTATTTRPTSALAVAATTTTTLPLPLRDALYVSLDCKTRLVQERRRYLNSLPRS